MPYMPCVVLQNVKQVFSKLTFLIENRFTAPQIAQIIGVSLSTIRRRMAKYRLSLTAEYATLTDEELDSVV